jgi:hypothetical protein
LQLETHFLQLKLSIQTAIVNQGQMELTAHLVKMDKMDKMELTAHLVKPVKMDKMELTAHLVKMVKMDKMELTAQMEPQVVAPVFRTLLWQLT